MNDSPDKNDEINDNSLQYKAPVNRNTVKRFDDTVYQTTERVSNEYSCLIEKVSIKVDAFLDMDETRIQRRIEFDQVDLGVPVSRDSNLISIDKLSRSSMHDGSDEEQNDFRGDTFGQFEEVWDKDNELLGDSDKEICKRVEKDFYGWHFLGFVSQLMSVCVVFFYLFEIFFNGKIDLWAMPVAQ